MNGMTTWMLVACTAAAVSVDAPRSAADLAARMIDAHGGMERWRAAPSVSFEREMKFSFAPGDVWLSRETTEQGSRRAYQDWPRDGARLAWDGQRVWSLGWNSDKRGAPSGNVNLGFYFLDLPWLTQDPGVRLEAPGPKRLPEGKREWPTLRMTFPKGEDYYLLFVDPANYRLRGVEYRVADAPVPAPFTHVFDELRTVDGLVVPVRYRTYGPDGKVFAWHEVRDWSFSRPFDASLLKPPAGAVVDRAAP